MPPRALLRLLPLSVLVAACARDVSSDATSGAPEGLTPEAQALRAEFDAVAEALEVGDNPFLSLGKVARVRASLREADERGRLELRLELIDALLQAGRVQEGIEAAQRGLAWVEESPARAGWLPQYLRKLGLAYLRQAEVENCVRRPHRECCLFPLEGGGLHTERGPARAALQTYRRYLELQPEQRDVLWLLNVAAMALGEYPDGLPEEQRIPVQDAAAGDAVGRFIDRGAELGVDAFSLCGGAAVEDFDGDGHLDVATCGYGPRDRLALFRGGPGLSFTPATREAGLEQQLGGLNLISADYDGDGDVDLFVLRGAWLFDHGQIRNSLLENDGQGRFRDVTRAAGLADPARPTQSACFGDFDGDGHLDLFIGNESRREIGPAPGEFPAQLFMNRGDGSFEDRAAEAGVTNDRYAKGVAAGDYDNDGDLDLYVSNIGANRLYRNDGTGHFVDVAPELGLTEPAGRSFAAWFFDYDEDGWLDLFVGAFQSTLADVAADALGEPHDGVSPRLYHNLGGRFVDVAAEVGLARPFLPMGAGFGDVDNDGWSDLYLATGEPGYEMLVPNALFRNEAGVAFRDVTRAAGLGHLQKGHGVAFADFDDDGDLDLYHQLGGFYPGDGFRNALFENPGHGRHWLRLRLVASRGHPAAIGARVRVDFAVAGETRSVHRAVGSVSSFGGGPLEQHLGLGHAQRILSLHVSWPGGGESEYADVPLDARLRLVEGREAFEIVTHP